jgi:hypothetical protein
VITESEVGAMSTRGLPSSGKESGTSRVTTEKWKTLH